MRRGLTVATRVTTAVLLGVGVLVAPGRSDAVAIARSGDCPRPPVTIDEIAHLTPARALSCFGGDRLTFVAYVLPHPYGIGGTTDHHVAPAWLDGLSGSFVALSAGPDVGPMVLAFVPPPSGAAPSRWTRPRAHSASPGVAG